MEHETVGNNKKPEADKLYINGSAFIQYLLLALSILKSNWYV